MWFQPVGLLTSSTNQPTKQCIVAVGWILNFAYFLVVTGHVLLNMHLSTLIQWILQRVQQFWCHQKFNQPPNRNSVDLTFFRQTLAEFKSKTWDLLQLSFFPGFLSRQCAYGILILFENPSERVISSSLANNFVLPPCFFICRDH